MARRLGRRRFLSTAMGATLLGSVSTAKETPTPESTEKREVRLEFLRPKEIKQAQAACPTIFQPLGTIEWHGVHNVVGVDAVKAHALCLQAAQRAGGVVSPALYGGVGGLSEPHTFIMEPENSVFSNLLRPWLEQLCREMVRDGFRAIIILTGHYSRSRHTRIHACY
ncbi:MAG: creatininase family protein [Planctomycetota bacterium]